MLAEWIESYGYIVVFLGCLLEGEMILILAGYSIARGYLEPGPTLLVGLAGALVADSTCFWVGRRLRGRFPPRSGGMRPVRARALLILRRWGRSAAFLTRFAYGLRIALPFLMGVGRMRPGLFHLFNLLGAAVFVSFYVGAGILFGETMEEMVDRIRLYEGRILAGILVLGLLAWGIRKWRLYRTVPLEPVSGGGAESSRLDHDGYR